MSVVLRLKRFGKKGQPTYRIVAIDERRKRQGKEVETLGNYDPNFDPPKITVFSERVKYWLGVGAKTSKTVASLLKKSQTK